MRIQQFALADQSRFPLIRELHRVIRSGSIDEIKTFHETNPDVTMTEDALGNHCTMCGCGYVERVSGASALRSSDRATNDAIEVIDVLYQIGLINRDNEIHIYVFNIITGYADWPAYLRLLEHILEREDLLDIRIEFDEEEPINILHCFDSSFTHFYGKPIPMVRRMYERMVSLGFQDTRSDEFCDVYDNSEFLRDRPEPDYSVWLKLSEDDIDFLP